MNDIYTHEGCLLAKGWKPRDEIVRAVMQREAFIGAFADLCEVEHNEAMIHGAVVRGDREGIAVAVRAHALGLWLDERLQRPGQLADWNGQMLDAISGLAAKDPQGVIDSLDAIQDPENDGAWLRGLAAGYIEQGRFVFGPTGQPMPAKPVRVASTILPRHIVPLRRGAKV